MNSGLVITLTTPIWSARVARLSGTPSAARRSRWLLSGWCRPYFWKTRLARKCAPNMPRGVTWNGAGGWLIASQRRQATFSRTVRMTL